MIDKGEMDANYDLVNKFNFIVYNFKVTYSMDGTHNLINRSKERKDNLFSYKLKDTAYNILVSYIVNVLICQFMGLTNGWWIWAGKPVAASETNDTGLANKQAEV